MGECPNASVYEANLDDDDGWEEDDYAYPDRDFDEPEEWQPYVT